MSAPASNQFPVQPTSGFLLNTTTLKYLTTCCFCLKWKMLQLCGEQCQPTWGPFLERSILLGAYYGCHQSCPIVKMTTFHFRLSNFRPAFFSCKTCHKTAFQNEPLNMVSWQLLQRSTRLAQKTIDPFKKKNKTKNKE